MLGVDFSHEGTGTLVRFSHIDMIRAAVVTRSEVDRCDESSDEY